MSTDVDSDTVTSSRRSRNAVGALASHHLAAPVAVGCCLAAGAAYVTAVDPSGSGGFLPCPFRSLTGWWCPGCGLTRATHHLLRGDVVQALRYHVFVMVVLTAIVVAWATWLRRRLSEHRRQEPEPGTPRRTPPPWLVGTAVVALIGFAVIRNLPGLDGLRG